MSKRFEQAIARRTDEKDLFQDKKHDRRESGVERADAMAIVKIALLILTKRR